MPATLYFDVDGERIPVTFHDFERVEDIPTDDVLWAEEYAREKKAKADAIANAPSMLGSAARGLGRSALPTAVGLKAGTATAAAVAPYAAATGPAAPFVTAGAGILSGLITTILASKAQQGVIDSTLGEDSLLGSKTAEIDYQTNPWSTAIGENLALAPNPRLPLNVAKTLATGAGRSALSKALRGTATEAEKRAFAEVADLGVGASVDAGVGLAQGRDLGEVGQDVLLGTIFNRPWREGATPRSLTEKLNQIQAQTESRMVDEALGEINGQDREGGFTPSSETVPPPPKNVTIDRKASDIASSGLYKDGKGVVTNPDELNVGDVVIINEREKVTGPEGRTGTISSEVRYIVGAIKGGEDKTFTLVREDADPRLPGAEFDRESAYRTRLDEINQALENPDLSEKEIADLRKEKASVSDELYRIEKEIEERDKELKEVQRKAERRERAKAKLDAAANPPIGIGDPDPIELGSSEPPAEPLIDRLLKARNSREIAALAPEIDEHIEGLEFVIKYRQDGHPKEVVDSWKKDLEELKSFANVAREEVELAKARRIARREEAQRKLDQYYNPAPRLEDPDFIPPDPIIRPEPFSYKAERSLAAAEQQALGTDPSFYAEGDVMSDFGIAQPPARASANAMQQEWQARLAEERARIEREAENRRREQILANQPNAPSPADAAGLRDQLIRQEASSRGLIEPIDPNELVKALGGEADEVIQPIPEGEFVSKVSDPNPSETRALEQADKLADEAMQDPTLAASASALKAMVSDIMQQRVRNREALQERTRETPETNKQVTQDQPEPDAKPEAKGKKQPQKMVAKTRVEDGDGPPSAKVDKATKGKDSATETVEKPHEQDTQEPVQRQQEVRREVQEPRELPVVQERPTAQAQEAIAKGEPEGVSKEDIDTSSQSTEKKVVDIGDFEPVLRLEAKGKWWTPERIDDILNWAKAGAEGDPPHGLKRNHPTIKKALKAMDVESLDKTLASRERRESLLESKKRKRAAENLNEDQIDFIAKMEDAGKLNEESGSVEFSLPETIGSSAGQAGKARVNESTVKSLRGKMSVSRVGRMVESGTLFINSPQDILTRPEFKDRQYNRSDLARISKAEGFFDPVLGKSVVITDNVVVYHGETPDLALRRVMVHERLGHQGFKFMYESDPHFRRLVDNFAKELPGSWTKEILEMYPELSGNPLRLVEEVFANRVQGRDPVELAKEDSGFRKIWNAIKDTVAKMFGIGKNQYLERQVDTIARMILSKQSELQAPSSANPIEYSLPLRRRVEEIEKDPVSDSSLNEIREGFAKAGSGILKMGKNFFRNFISNPMLELGAIANGALQPYLKAYEFTVLKSAQDAADRLDAGYTISRKMKAKDSILSSIYTRMGELDKARAIWRTYGGEEAVKVYNDLIENQFPYLLEQQRKVGMNIRNAAFEGRKYLPMEVKDVTELRQWMRDNGFEAEFEAAVREASQQTADEHGYRPVDLSQGEIASIALGKLIRPSSVKGKHTKSRTIPDELLPEMAEFYRPLHESLSNYVFNYSNNIAAVKFIGQDAIANFKSSVRDAESGANQGKFTIPVGSPIGAKIAQLEIDGKITLAEKERVYEIINARLGYKPDGDFTAIVKAMNMPLALANPFSAIRQLTDAFVGIHRTGLTHTLFGLKGAAKTVMDDLNKKMAERGFMTRNEQLQYNGITPLDINLMHETNIGNPDNPMREFANSLAKWSGFKFGDIMPAQLQMGAWESKMRSLSDDEIAAYLEPYRGVLSKSPEEVAKVIKSGNTKNDIDVQFLAMSELSDIRPMSISSLPLAAIKDNSALTRIAYNLKAWGMFQFSNIYYNGIRKIIMGHNQGDKGAVQDGFKTLIGLAGGLVMSGATVDSAIDYLLGRDVDLAENVKDNVFKLFLMSSYQWDQIVGDQPDTKSAVLGIMNTPLLSVTSSLVDSAVKGYHKGDVAGHLYKDYDLWRTVPFGIGTIGYWRFSDLSDGKKSAAVDRRIPDSVQKIREEYSSLRAKGESGRLGADRYRWNQISKFKEIEKYYISKAKAAIEDNNDYALAQQMLMELDDIAKKPSSWSIHEKGIKARQKLESK